MAAPASGVSLETIERAVKALLKWRDTKSQTQKPQLLEHDEFLYLILTLKKIPQQDKSRINPYKISLPHPLLDPKTDSSEFCLIIDDRPKSGLTKDDVKKKVESDGIPVSKIIKLSKLRTDYQAFEAKRKLCGSYDMFFADKRVIPLLPKMLGKQFFKRKKIPVGVDLKHKNWKEQIEKACGSGLLFLRTGTCSVVKVGRISMGREAIVANVAAAIEGIIEVVPKKWSGIRSFHLKLLDSLALPLYQSVPDLKLKIQGAKDEEEAAENMKEKVKEVKSSGKKKRKGRIHEVRYMDSDDATVGDVFSGEDDDDDDDDDEEEFVTNGDAVDDDDLDGEGTVARKLDGKKRKKADENGTKQAKMAKKALNVEAKMKSEDGVKLKKQKRNSKSGEVQGKEKKMKRKVLAAK